MESHFGHEERIIVEALNAVEVLGWASGEPPDFMPTDPAG
jgi:hypothetical protein